MKQQFLQLTEQKNIKLIKECLENLPKRDKGSIFEWYLAQLYQGNGWLTKVQGGRGDSGADILLYHPKTPHQVSLIVQAKNYIFCSNILILLYLFGIYKYEIPRQIR